MAGLATAKNHKPEIVFTIRGSQMARKTISDMESEPKTRVMGQLEFCAFSARLDDARDPLTLGVITRTLCKLHKECATRRPKSHTRVFCWVTLQQPQVALQHTFWGDVSYLLPMPKAWLLQRSALTTLLGPKGATEFRPKRD